MGAVIHGEIITTRIGGVDRHGVDYTLEFRDRVVSGIAALDRGLAIAMQRVSVTVIRHDSLLSIPEVIWEEGDEGDPTEAWRRYLAGVPGAPPDGADA